MGISQLGGTTATSGNTTYGSSWTGGGASISANTTHDSPASVTFTTTGGTTKWLVEIDADIKWATGGSPPTDVILNALVDGSYIACSGAFGVSSPSNAGYVATESTVRGRTVAYLSAGSHTITASIVNGSSTTAITRRAVAITVTQLAG